MVDIFRTVLSLWKKDAWCISYRSFFTKTKVGRYISYCFSSLTTNDVGKFSTVPSQPKQKMVGIFCTVPSLQKQKMADVFRIVPSAQK